LVLLYDNLTVQIGDLTLCDSDGRKVRDPWKVHLMDEYFEKLVALRLIRIKAKRIARKII
jgi:hypothetical protein